jgi:hypothetical protein
VTPVVVDVCHERHRSLRLRCVGLLLQTIEMLRYVMPFFMAMVVAKSNAETSPLGIAALILVCIGIIGTPIYYVFKSRRRP